MHRNRPHHHLDDLSLEEHAGRGNQRRGREVLQGGDRLHPGGDCSCDLRARLVRAGYANHNVHQYGDLDTGGMATCLRGGPNNRFEEVA